MKVKNILMVSVTSLLVLSSCSKKKLNSGEGEVEKELRDDVKSKGSFSSINEIADSLSEIGVNLKGGTEIVDIKNLFGEGVLDSVALERIRTKGFVFDRVQGVQVIKSSEAGIESWVFPGAESSLTLKVKKDAAGTWNVIKGFFTGGKKSSTPTNEEGAVTNGESVAAANVSNRVHKLTEVEKAKLLNKLGSQKHMKAFIDALEKRDFSKLKKLVQADKISDAKLAALCILMEEGEYVLSKKEALKQVFLREKTAGFYVKLNSISGAKRVQFSIITQMLKGNWKIGEINLDGLLASYMKSLGSDVNQTYVPIFKNIDGVDKVAVYFSFDSNKLSARTQKQLEIIANFLKVNSSGKITLSGHADNKGADSYNDTLSFDRAKIVKEFLVSKGVASRRVELKFYGSKNPILPNKNKDGSDNPLGRTANRRTEILLSL